MQPLEIKRKESEEIRKIHGWMILFGRRKVGKTYLLKHFLKYDAYLLVRRDGTVITENIPEERIEDLNLLNRIVKDLLAKGKTVVIDEYQRLPHSFFDELSTSHPKGKIILSGSVVSTIHKFFGTGSPLLGMLAEYKLGLLAPDDALRQLKGLKEHSIEYAAFIRDPWLVPNFSYTEITEDLYYAVTRFKNAVPRLIGETFQEENRELTKTYEAIIREVGAGYRRSAEIAHILSNKKIIKKDDARLIHPFLKNLVAMDLFEEVPVFLGRGYHYRIKSPIIELFYYLADRHNIEEREAPFSEVKENVQKIRNFAVQNFVGDFFADGLEGNKEISIIPEIDFIITKGRKRDPVLAGEVKWGSWKKDDVIAFSEKVKQLKCRKVFFVKEKMPIEVPGIEILDWKDLLTIIS